MQSLGAETSWKGPWPADTPTIWHPPRECRLISWRGQSALEVCWEWSDSVELDGLLDNARGEWRTLFRAKGSDTRYLGVGSLFRATLADLEREDPAGLAFYGGFPFHEAEHPSALWGELGGDLLIAPELEWRLGPQGAELRARTLVDATDVLRRDIDRVRERAANVLERATPPAPTPEPGRLIIASQQSGTTREAWEGLVSDILLDIARGKLAKVVPARSLTLQCPEPLSSAALLSALGAKGARPATYLIGVVDPHDRAFLSLSPERLFAWQGARISVDMLAGTRPRSAQREEDARLEHELRSTPKELDEHRVLTRYVRERLSEQCHDLTVINDESILKLDYVQHLYSAFEATCYPESSPIRVLRTLHPTPAVAGYPTIEARRLLATREGFPRGWYGGGVGRCDGRSGDFSLGIRCAVVDQSRVTLFAGAGVVAGSDSATEWSETEVKLSSFLHRFVNV